MTEEDLVKMCCTTCGAVKITDLESEKNWIDNSGIDSYWKSECVGNCDGHSRHDKLEHVPRPKGLL